MNMDNFDKAILRQLQINNQLSTQQIGENIGLSATACQRRLKKLRSSSLIEKEVAILNTEAIDSCVSLIVNIVMKQGSSEYIQRFKQIMTAQPAIQQCFYVTGESDFILVICVPNMQHFEQLTQALFLDDENILKFHSTVVMDTVKRGLNIPI